jgi:hypothetical protein
LQPGVPFERYKAHLEQKWKEMAALGSLRDLRTLLQFCGDFDGQQELQSYIGLRFERGDVLVRVLKDPGGRVYIDGARPPQRMEAILAPIADSTYSAWEFKLGTGTRFDFQTAADQSARVFLRGRVAKVEAIRLPGK